MADKRRVIFISDFSAHGSGYLNISTKLCLGLQDMGMEVKALGLGYFGEEHPYTFSLLPAKNAHEIHAMLNNLYYLWRPEIVVSAIDIPYLVTFAEMAHEFKLPMIGITPLESDPLCMTWANPLSKIRKVFVISQFGTDEFRKAGVEAEHIQIGIDTKSWRPTTPAEKQKFREAIGIQPDEFVILTVADNQERKNLSAAMDILGRFKRKFGVKFRYILVTAEDSRVGWYLRDLACTYGINAETMIFERGMSFSKLWSAYGLSDLFLLTSKAEGLGMPVLESMSVGLPVVATRTGAIPELLEPDRGFVIDPEYSILDVWGNANRYFINKDKAVEAIARYCFERPNYFKMLENARKYVEGRTWDIPVHQLAKAIEEVLHVEEKPAQ